MEEGSPHSPQVQVTMVGRGRRDWHLPHAGQRGERGAYSCDKDSHGALPWHYRQPEDPFVPFSPHGLQLWREQPRSFPCPQRAGDGWKAGAVPAPCSRAAAGTTEEMCQKITVTLVPDSPEEVSREKAPTDCFSPWNFSTTPCKPLTHPWLSGASTSGGTHASLCPKTPWSA